MINFFIIFTYLGKLQVDDYFETEISCNNFLVKMKYWFSQIDISHQVWMTKTDKTSILAVLLPLFSPHRITGTFDTEITSHHIVTIDHAQRVTSINNEMKGHLFTEDNKRYFKLTTSCIAPPSDSNQTIEDIISGKKGIPSNPAGSHFYEVTYEVLRMGIADVSNDESESPRDPLFLPVIIISRPIVLLTEDRLNKIKKERSEPEVIFINPKKSETPNKPLPSSNELKEISSSLMESEKIKQVAEKFPPRTSEIEDENKSLDLSAIEIKYEKLSQEEAPPSPLSTSLSDSGENIQVVQQSPHSSEESTSNHVSIGAELLDDSARYNVNFDESFYSNENRKLRQQVDLFVQNFFSQTPLREFQVNVVLSFVEETLDSLLQTSLWRKATEHDLEFAKFRVEKLLFEKLYHVLAFSDEDLELDAKFTSWVSKLQCLGPKNLLIAEEVFNSSKLVFKKASKELNLINLCCHPLDKVDCIVNCSKILSGNNFLLIFSLIKSSHQAIKRGYLTQ